MEISDHTQMPEWRRGIMTNNNNVVTNDTIEPMTEDQFATRFVASLNFAVKIAQGTKSVNPYAVSDFQRKMESWKQEVQNDLTGY
jgi:hypothetical protein